MNARATDDDQCDSDDGDRDAVDGNNFNEWFLKALRDSMVGAQYPEAARAATEAVISWRERMDPKMFRKLCRGNRIFKVCMYVCMHVCM